MRGLESIFPSHLTEESVVSVAALILLFLSIGTVIWPKFTSLVALIWGDLRKAVLAVMDLFDEVKSRRSGPVTPSVPLPRRQTD